MPVIETRLIYEAFGFTIASDIPLPELSGMIGGCDYIDIEIKHDYDLIHEVQLAPYDFVVENQRVSVFMPEAAVFRIESGNKIIISPISGADEDLIRLYVLGTCMGAILLQRKIYPLHGSAVAIDGKAYAFVGHSGAGKSTLASAFISRGYPLISDDVIAVSFDSDSGSPMITPSYPQQKLWQQSLDAFGVGNESLRSIYGRENKYCISVEDEFCSSPLPLAGVFELVKTDSEQVGVQSIMSLQRLDVLFHHTYRQFLVQKLGLTQWHFTRSAALAAGLPMHRLHRPEKGFSAHQLVDLILNVNNVGE